ncbi:ADP-ribosylation factor-binding protein GGA3a isoform X1 [Antennarius striatus]|uniref:ADP-ribosylation factor-binding protein GGA3a isoform X1 n=1 Tax=Antennarius striatus TaxID=241820 RepID=UPI0035B3AA9A
MAGDGESLESWLNKATNPSNSQEEWKYIMGFCEQVNKELEGPQISVRLLSHKIQSPQEWEAIQALTVLETCMKNCGQRFHNEVGKFRFLNELIKVISPKYLGEKVSERVKTKVIEMLYSWTFSFPDEAKITEAYQMLKSQGIVSSDPTPPPDATVIPSSSPRPKNPVFDDEKKSQRLAELLRSKKPEDLQEANRFIKNMVKEDEVRTQKLKKQETTLESVNNSVQVLNEMLANFNPNDSTEGDKELLRDLYGDCDKLRESIAQIATETEDNDNSLGDILQASDDLFHVINSYKKIVEEQTINGETQHTGKTQSSGRQGSGCTNQSEVLIDLMDLDSQSTIQSQNQPPPSAAPSAPSASQYLLDEELMSLDFNKPFSVPSKSTSVNLNNHLSSLQDSNQNLALPDSTSSLGPPFSTHMFFPDALSSALVSPANSSSTTSSTLNISTPLDYTKYIPAVSRNFPQSLSSVLTTTLPPALPAPPQALIMASTAPSATFVPPPLVPASSGVSNVPSSYPSHNLQDLALLDLGSPKNVGITSTSLLFGGMQGGSTPSSAKCQADDSPLLHSLSPILPLSQTNPGSEQEVSLSNVFVPLDTIKPSHVCPITAYDKNGIRLLLHFAIDCPAGRPDVLVMVASILNTAPLAIRDIILQAAVPKMMKVKLQPPSGTELAPFNPILPPPSITQVMLLANPLKEKVRMKYKLTFTLGEQPYTEVGEVNEFPSAGR